MRAALAFMGVVTAAAACTFPDVDYADTSTSTSTGGSGGEGTSSTSSGGTCTAPSNCASKAATCTTQAENKHKACTKACQKEPACISGCDDALHGDRVQCSAQCDSCAKPECGNAQTSCSSLVGL